MLQSRSSSPGISSTSSASTPCSCTLPNGVEELVEVAGDEVLAGEHLLEAVGEERLDDERIDELLLVGADVLDAVGSPEQRCGHAGFSGRLVGAELVEEARLRRGLADVEQVLPGQGLAMLQQHLDAVVGAGQKHRAAKPVRPLAEEELEPRVAPRRDVQARGEARIGRLGARRAEQIDPDPPAAQIVRHGHGVGRAPHQDRRRELRIGCGPFPSQESHVTLPRALRPARPRTAVRGSGVPRGPVRRRSCSGSSNPASC